MEQKIIRDGASYFPKSERHLAFSLLILAVLGFYFGEKFANRTWFSLSFLFPIVTFWAGVKGGLYLFQRRTTLSVLGGLIIILAGFYLTLSIFLILAMSQG